MFACVFVPRPPLPAGRARHAGRSVCPLLDLAREFSPRVEAPDDWLVLLDVSGLERMTKIGVELGRAALRRGWAPRVAVASTRTTALLAAHARPGLTIVPPGDEARTLAPLPMAALETVWAMGVHSWSRRSEDEKRGPIFEVLRRWGVRTLGDLVALPSADLSARLGPEGPVLQRLACGADPRPLVPVVDPERFEASCDLEWPIEGLEPLSFVLTRMLEPLCARLERADRGVAALTVRLTLTTRETHERSRLLAAPLRDPRVLRTLALLDLESHPPLAGVDRVTVVVEPTPGRVTQFSLIESARPSPEQLSTLLARLTALMGEGRVGRPALVESHRPGAFEVETFDPDVRPDTKTNAERRRNEDGTNTETTRTAPGVVRRFRVPLVARVAVDEGRPVRVTTGRRELAGGRVDDRAGPWCASGGWWHQAWDRDEWDVLAADGIVYRLFRDRVQDRWFIEGIID